MEKEVSGFCSPGGSRAAGSQGQLPLEEAVNTTHLLESCDDTVIRARKLRNLPPGSKTSLRQNH